MALTYSVPLWIHAAWVQWSDAADLDESVAKAAERPDRRARMLALQTAFCRLLFLGMLVLRSRTMLDFIYFQF